MAERIETYRDLRVFHNAMEAAMEIFKLTKRFPTEEKHSMVDQIRRSSRSVCTNIAEAWRKRRYEGAFIAKLSDSEGERRVSRRFFLSSPGGASTLMPRLAIDWIPPTSRLLSN